MKCFLYDKLFTQLKSVYYAKIGFKTLLWIYVKSILDISHAFYHIFHTCSFRILNSMDSDKYSGAICCTNR